jgi:hypothetical protein
MEGRRARPNIAEMAVEGVTVTTETTPSAVGEPAMKKVRAEGRGRPTAKGRPGRSPRSGNVSLSQLTIRGGQSNVGAGLPVASLDQASTGDPDISGTFSR